MAAASAPASTTAPAPAGPPGGSAERLGDGPIFILIIRIFGVGKVKVPAKKFRRDTTDGLYFSILFGVPHGGELLSGSGIGDLTRQGAPVSGYIGDEVSGCLDLGSCCIAQQPGSFRGTGLEVQGLRV
jgi:hypothetical protein